MDTVITEATRSEEKTSINQHNDQSTRETASTSKSYQSSSYTSCLNTAPRFCDCCLDDYFQDAEIDQAQYHMSLDLLSVGTKFDYCPSNESKSSILEIDGLKVESPSFRLNIENLLEAARNMRTKGRLPTEVWLAEEDKDGPFNAISGARALNSACSGDFNDSNGLSSGSLDAIDTKKERSQLPANLRK